MTDVDKPNASAAAVPAPGSGPAHTNTSRARESRFRRGQRLVLPPLVLGIFILGLWYFISYGILDEQRRFLLRPPHAVWLVGFADWGNFTEILGGLWSSMQVALIGLTVAILIGLALATLMSQSELIERAVFPYAVTLQAIPILAIVPLIGFWFGFGVSARVIVCVIIALFPIIVNTLFGLLSAPRGLHDLFTLQRASRLTRLRKLMFPAALPAIFAGLRISAGLSVIGAIVGDFFFGRGDPGIGQLLQRYANRLLGEQLIAAIIMSSLLGVLVFQLFGWLQTWAIGAWHEQRDAEF
ncbi:MAG: ABC transporter permease [Caldilineaceae bacterium]